MGKHVYNYYAGGNTAKGFYDLFEETLKRLDRIFILKGGPGTGKSTLMKKIGESWKSDDNIEYIHCSADYGSIDGVIIPDLKIGIVDGTAPHVIEPKYPGVIEEYVNLGEAWDSEQLRMYKEPIFQVKNQIKACYDKAYKLFAEALDIHDEWEKIYIEHLSPEKARQLTNRLKQTIFGDKTLHKKGASLHRFLGSATPEGPKDFIQNLTDDIPKRLFIKGRPGTGKSTMLKKLAIEGENRGLEVEVYHCGFDPESLDMLIFRELGVAIFDSTSPHEHFPSREGDEIVDMYEEVIQSGTDEKYEEEIKTLSNRYKEKMKQATAKLKESNHLRNQLESFYIDAVDFSIVEQKQAELEQEIVAWKERLMAI
ncbi:hypothetical protein SAMN05421676_103249 [Salinibacillus kushneri]|uniref:Uncharacterized protein n=1 Tax=Salinibacillus kushneri TaxID=237682 RepID=A0A1I0CQ85_9BACI|nr:PRK06851 family protein [Salinibacillus kushneri]SET21676.1 hypothetical protein SAMN05421676_103249 [Salinibacillus kushneri]